MSLNTTTGLIIKEQKVGENDRLATILTSDLGLIRAFVPGAMKLKSKILPQLRFYLSPIWKFISREIHIK